MEWEGSPISLTCTANSSQLRHPSSIYFLTYNELSSNYILLHWYLILNNLNLFERMINIVLKIFKFFAIFCIILHDQSQGPNPLLLDLPLSEEHLVNFYLGGREGKGKKANQVLSVLSRLSPSKLLGSVIPPNNLSLIYIWYREK